MILQIPAGLTRAEELEWADTMLARLHRRQSRLVDDDDLLARARQLSRRHLDGLAVPVSVRWVDNQRSRWGSCTMADRTIRLSRRLQALPSYVVDYVLVHELGHLLVPHHGDEFWAWVDRYPRTERARGFLEGATLACGDGSGVSGRS